MWVMKISYPYNENALVGNLAKKHNVTIIGYPVSNEIKKDGVYVIASGIFLGNDKQLKDFSRDMNKDKRTLRLEIKNKFGITYMKQNLINKCLYEAGIFHLKPSIVNPDGTYIFELAAWEKEKLMKIIKAHKQLNVKLHWIKQKTITNIQLLNVFPSLTEKQQKCLQLAIDNKYYDYPRKTDLKSLAKLAGISYSTYQFHLRVAEKKIIPFLNTKI